MPDTPRPWNEVVLEWAMAQLRATDACYRVDHAVSEKAYKAAVSDYRSYYQTAYALLRELRRHPEYKKEISNDHA